MEENSRPMGESPNGIAMPDAAITGPGRSGSAFVYVTFLPSPFGPGYEAGIRGWEGNYDPVDGWADGAYYPTGCGFFIRTDWKSRLSE